MPLANGSFKKPLIQNDAVGMKPLPSSVLDRFRAMVKEREEELQVFGGEVVLPLNTVEIVRLYEIVLSELTLNSKPIINDLTIIAGEQRVHGKGIADVICARIIEVPVDQKLPSLYLLDSIVKNIGKDYVNHFSGRLPEVFCEAYAEVRPNMHPAMRHLFRTWSAVFPLSTLCKIEATLQFSPSVNGQSSGLSSLRASESPRPTHGIHVNPTYLEAQHQFGHSTVDGDSNQSLKTSAAYSYNNGVDLRGPRALINAYGIDEREKKMTKYQMAEQLDANAIEQKVAIRTWQHTEEEEFDWDDMTPSLADRRQCNENYSSFRPPPGNLTARHSFTRHRATPSVTDYTGNWSQTQVSSVLEEVPHISSGHGAITKIASMLPNVVGPSDSTSQPMASSFARESLILPQQSQSHLNAKGSGSFLENRSFFTAGEQMPRTIGNFPSANMKFCGPLNVGSTLSYTHDSSVPEIQSVDAEALTKAWHPAKFQSSQALPSFSALPPQMHARGQFGMKNAGNINFDQGSNTTVHSQQHLGSTRNMSQRNLSQIPSLHPGPVPLNLQNPAHASLAQPNLLMSQVVRQNLPLSSASAPSRAMLPPLNHGYLAQGHGPPTGTAFSNLVPGVQSFLPVLNAPNASFHLPGAALPSLSGGALSGTTQAIPFSLNTSQVAPNPAVGGAISGLISSLMAQGLISLTKQDSVGVEFDQDSLKVRHESAITALYADLPRQCKTCGLRFINQEEHSKHMDWHVNKNRTLKNRKTNPAPKWFVSVNMWLHGAEALGTEAVPGFLPAENTVEKDDEELAVPADEDQNACALCGEPFVDFYSDEMEEWMYKGAVYMYAPAGSSEGMNRSELGPIVHSKCRSDSHGIPSEDFMKDQGESTEEGYQRKRMRV